MITSARVTPLALALLSVGAVAHAQAPIDAARRGTWPAARVTTTSTAVPAPVVTTVRPASPVATATDDVSVPAETNEAGEADSAPAAPAAAPLAAPAVQEPATTPAPAVVRGRFPGVTVTLGGSVRTTITTTTARMVPDATPFFVLPDFGADEGSTKLDARLSTFLLAIDGLPWKSFRFGGVILAQFFDGDLLSGQYGFYPGALYGYMANEDWKFSFGMQMDVFSPRIPTMIDSMSAFASSGNPGNSFKTQFRGERYVKTGAHDTLTITAAVADALPTNIAPNFTQYTENTGVPNGEVRVAWTRASSSKDSVLGWSPFEAGASAVTGAYRTFSPTGEFRQFETRLWGAAADAGVQIGRRLGLQGEVYTGASMGPYLGAINQTVNLQTHEAIRSAGGWGEVAWAWSPRLRSYAGYGIDAVDEGDVAIGSFLTNETAFANVWFDQSRMTRFGVEGTWRRTEYAGGGRHEGYAVMLMSEFRF
jgi:hypothetical protein